MYLKSLELNGFKSFGKKEFLDFNTPISAIVGPNGSGKSNITEAFRFVLGEQSLKSMRGKRGEDLIFNGGKSAPRANRASVRVVLDNTSRLFDVDFDELVVERVVHRDGINQYFVNGTQVRLRDVVELLSAGSIGSSGHHIISQGEADRVLNANTKERREMIEDALGLKVFRYKLSESEKKLQKTKENITQVELLRKEISPHLHFLKKQVERVEKMREMREVLREKYREYLKRESVYIHWWSERIARERMKPEKELSDLERGLEEAKGILEREHKSDEKSKQVIGIEVKLRELREEKGALVHDIGRIEGEILAEERSLKRLEREEGNADERVVRVSVLRSVIDEIDTFTDKAESENSVEILRDIMRKVKAVLHTFIEKEEETDGSLHKGRSVKELEELRRMQEGKSKLHEKLLIEESSYQKEYVSLQQEIESVRGKSREAERNVFAIMEKQNALRAELSSILDREKEIERARNEFRSELEEGAVLVGRGALSYEDYSILDSSGTQLSDEEIAKEQRSLQDGRSREIEKIKIRLEEFGGGEDMIKEYREVKDRDSFLESEIADLERSVQSLKEIMIELEDKLKNRFKDGIAKINQEFATSFSVMFGGGSASLKLVKDVRKKSSGSILLDEISNEGEESEEAKTAEGIEIVVSLPHKRIKDLVMLSGGERALTSIALIFAMSQVNPPPFLILDETDAALDEANSKRYGDIVENLSKYSQLILITHNRETMARASILYGVTMGIEGISKLLSVKFNEAIKVAK